MTLTPKPFPSLELNMSRLSPNPNRSGKRAIMNPLSNQENKQNEESTIVDTSPVDFANSKNFEEEEDDDSNELNPSKSLLIEDVNLVDTEGMSASDGQLDGNDLNDSNSCEPSTYPSSRDNLEQGNNVVKTEYDIIMEETAKLIAEAECNLEDMRIIQVKNAILMDTLVMIGG